MVIAMPRASALGSTRSASRISPPRLAATHHPPKEKNAATVAPAIAGRRGAEPARCATRGTKWPKSPAPLTNPQTTSAARAPSFRTVTPRRMPSPMRRPIAFAAANRRTHAIATTFCPPAVSGATAETYAATPVASAAVSPGSITSRHFQP